MVLVAAWVAELHVGTDETLLVAQQNHDLQRKTTEGTVIQLYRMNGLDEGNVLAS